MDTGHRIFISALGMEGKLMAGRYAANDRLALYFESDHGEPLAVVTVNLPEVDLEDGEFFVKTWSENERLVPDLLASGIFTDTGKRVPTGFVEAQVWRFVDGGDPCQCKKS